jgi:hypothetical protein
MSPQQQAPPPRTDPMMQKVLMLVALHKQARHKLKLADLSFMMVNQTFNVVPYRHCAFWRWDGKAVTVEAASGLVQIDPTGPYALWLKSVIARLIREKSKEVVFSLPGQPKPEETFVKSYPITAADCAGLDQQNWPDWASSHAMLVTMKGVDGDIHSGLWFDREEAFGEMDTAFLDDICDSYAHVIQKLEGRSGAPAKMLRNKGSWAKRFAILAILAMFLPVRMTVTAPAEVVPSDPRVVGVPFDGVIEKVMVKPNQPVQKGDLLVVMDQTALKNRSELVEQELDTAEQALTKTEREALKDPTKLTDLNLLKAQIRTKTQDKKYADELLTRAEIRAEADGIIVFPDANALRGKPVQTGEQIMLLADPGDTELLVRIPVDSMIELDTEVPVSFYLNVTPLVSQQATVETVSYQASMDHDGLMTYKMRAHFSENETAPRIGSTGTAKAYGEKTLFGINVLRRPLVTLRRHLGV